ncbi:MAG: DUF5615 family PIN-like protein [Ignavibacteriae bacterium]|nr:DUF5615 family PIN-like protein [Ignavibacteriota bacterium]
MKLLLDQHLSYRLVPKLSDFFPGSKHVKDFEMTEVDDEVIWQFAATNDFVIVSKDTDFFHRSSVRGSPPKVIFLRVGNCTSKRILATILDNRTRSQFCNESHRVSSHFGMNS